MLIHWHYILLAILIYFEMICLTYLILCRIDIIERTFNKKDVITNGIRNINSLRYAYYKSAAMIWPSAFIFLIGYYLGILFHKTLIVRGNEDNRLASWVVQPNK